MPPRHPTPPVAAMLASGGLACGLIAFGALAATPHKPHHAQAAPSTKPATFMQPAPSARRASTAPPAPTSRDVEPETTATIPARAAPRPAEAAAAGAKGDVDPLPAPFRLPTASRARMRDCGLKWQAMKMSGAAGDDIWRDFATRCLAADDTPR